MNRIYIFILLTLHLFDFSNSLQTGYTCESTVDLSCPSAKKLVILEVTYSTECTKQSNQTSLYAPSRCIARRREPISTKCNGRESCTIDNTLGSNPSFMINEDANCAFQGQSLNVEYSCIPDFKTDELPSIDICSSESLEGIKEGFIYSPNYPKNYGTNLDCSQTILVPQTGHRLKIYAIRLNTKSIISLLPNGPKRIDDWLEINHNGEKLTTLGSKSYSLLYEDIIQATLTFKTQSQTSKQDALGFLLYFIVTPIRRSRPPPTASSSSTSTTTEEVSTSAVVEEKKAALFIEKKEKKQSNLALILVITLLSAVLLVTIIGFFLYKRGNDRRVRYLEETFQAFLPKSKTVEPYKSNEEMKDFSSSSSSSPPTDKYHVSEHIYSDNPVERSNDDSACFYERIDDDIIKKPKQINV